MALFFVVIKIYHASTLRSLFMQQRRIKDKSICLSCYWAYPESYEHIAMRQIRRIDLLWESEGIEIYERLKQKAVSLEKELPELVKEIIEHEVRRNDNS
jgi:hypothetical protein